MRNTPLKINQTFFLTNEQESGFSDIELATILERQLNRRTVKVKIGEMIA